MQKTKGVLYFGRWFGALALSSSLTVGACAGGRIHLPRGPLVTVCYLAPSLCTFLLKVILYLFV